MDKYLHLRGCQTPWRYEGDCWGSPFQGKRWISWGAVVLQQQAGLVGSFCSSSWVVLGKILGFWGLEGGCHPTAPPGESKHGPTDVWPHSSGAVAAPSDGFPWENEEEKCRIQGMCAAPFLGYPEERLSHPRKSIWFCELLFPPRCGLRPVRFSLSLKSSSGFQL